MGRKPSLPLRRLQHSKALSAPLTHRNFALGVLQTEGNGKTQGADLSEVYCLGIDITENNSPWRLKWGCYLQMDSEELIHAGKWTNMYKFAMKQEIKRRLLLTSKWSLRKWKQEIQIILSYVYKSGNWFWQAKTRYSILRNTFKSYVQYPWVFLDMIFVNFSYFSNTQSSAWSSGRLSYAKKPAFNHVGSSKS